MHFIDSNLVFQEPLQVFLGHMRRLLGIDHASQSHWYGQPSVQALCALVALVPEAFSTESLQYRKPSVPKAFSTGSLQDQSCVEGAVDWSANNCDLCDFTCVFV
jgi:hypothetical protein